MPRKRGNNNGGRGEIIAESLKEKRKAWKR